MQYLVREIQSNASAGNGTIFKTLPEAIKHLQKVSETQQFVVGEREGKVGTLAQLEGFLKERLSTISLHAIPNEQKQWIITAFE
jgi:hypothetical protein